MDSRLEKALEFSNYMTTLNNHKKILREKFLESSVYYYGGGTFTVTQQLINFCYVMTSNNQTNIVLIDDNDIPINVEDVNMFYEDIINLYFTSTQSYLAEYEKIKTNRSSQGLLEL